ncbi:MAG: hypothetical protein ABIH41_01180 [Nanoarchaeota archaeon]
MSDYLFPFDEPFAEKLIGFFATIPYLKEHLEEYQWRRTDDGVLYVGDDDPRGQMPDLYEPSDTLCLELLVDYPFRTPHFWEVWRALKLERHVVGEALLSNFSPRDEQARMREEETIRLLQNRYGCIIYDLTLGARCDS